jgi:hypothetical protein
LIGRLEVEDSGVKDEWHTKAWNVRSAEAEAVTRENKDRPISEILLPNANDENVPSNGNLVRS